MAGDDLVYSSDHGRICPRCGKPKSSCSCSGSRRSESRSGPAGRIRVQRTSKGRKGKTVTIVSGLDLDAFELADLARELKQTCGSGGTAKDGVIEIQGDHVDRLVSALREKGLDARRSGG